jgi:glucose/mannose-6-phosphate isomerase
VTRTAINAEALTTHAEMKAYLQGFPDDLVRSTRQVREWMRSVSDEAPRPRALGVVGVGGSAMAGDLARALLRPQAAAPFEVIREYVLPGWVDAGAWVIASSYSGNTEETLSAFSEAVSRRVPVWVLTSGGELQQRAAHARCPIFHLPPGIPPRAAVGWSLPFVLLAAAQLIGPGPDTYAEGLEEAAARLQEKSRSWAADEGENPVRDLAERLAEGFPIFYAGTGLYEPAAVRWRAQLAENAKMLSFHHLLPEMDHNEIVGWQENPDLLRRCRAVFLTGSHEHPQVARRIEITAELIQPFAAGVEIVRPSAGSVIEELLELVLLGDYVSLFASAAHGVEPVPVERISRLKALLQKDAGPA